MFEGRDNSAAITDDLDRPLAANSTDVGVVGTRFHHHEHPFLKHCGLVGNNSWPFGNCSSDGMAGVMGILKPPRITISRSCASSSLIRNPGFMIDTACCKAVFAALNNFRNPGVNSPAITDAQESPQ